MSNNTKPSISIIAAISKNARALGFKNKLLWKIEGDLPRFKAITNGHPIIMGRLTYESIGRPLPNRTNIVISRSNRIQNQQNLIVVESISDAIETASKIDSDEVFIIGGGQIFNETVELADKLYLTVVDDEAEADVFFPEYNNFTKETYREDHPEHKPPFFYVNLEK